LQWISAAGHEASESRKEIEKKSVNLAFMQMLFPILCADVFYNPQSERKHDEENREKRITKNELNLCTSNKRLDCEELER